MFNPLKDTTMSIYDIKMTGLNHYDNGKPTPFWNPEDGEHFGIDSFEFNGETFKSDDIVVVGGEIGNIEIVNISEGIAGLGLSFDYDECMHNPYDWTMSSGYRCKMDGLRHATDEEIKKYEISSGLCCDAAERADIAYKEKRIWG